LKNLAGISETEEKIIKWVTDEGWGYKKEDDPNFYFLYRVFVVNEEFFIGMEKRVGRITIHRFLLLTEDEQQSYKLTYDKEEYHKDVSRKLLFTNIGVQMVPSVEKLEKIDIMHKIYSDALTQDRLYHSIVNMSHTASLCRELWQEFVKSHTTK
jgi:hypothetical protein